MGYSTDFEGEFKVTPNLTAADMTDLQTFADQDHRAPDGFNAKAGMPGIWCQWVPSQDGTVIEWDGGEKFYEYVEWLKWLIENKLAPKGYVLNGTVDWQGEESSDSGRIVVRDNVVFVQTGHVTYSDEVQV